MQGLTRLYAPWISWPMGACWPPFHGYVRERSPAAGGVSEEAEAEIPHTGHLSVQRDPCDHSEHSAPRGRGLVGKGGTVFQLSASQAKRLSAVWPSWSSRSQTGCSRPSYPPAGGTIGSTKRLSSCWPMGWCGRYASCRRTHPHLGCTGLSRSSSGRWRRPPCRPACQHPLRN